MLQADEEDLNRIEGQDDRSFNSKDSHEFSEDRTAGDGHHGKSS